MAFKKNEQLNEEEIAKLNEKSSNKKHKHHSCSGEKCKCNDNCECGENCTCDSENKCNDSCCCGENCDCQKDENFSFLEMAQRIQAEFDNYRKRTANTEKEARKKGVCDAVEKFLPVIDSLDNAKRQVTDENFKKALDLVNSQMLQSLTSLGVEKIDALGQMFDPNLHNAIMAGADETKPDEIILEEFQSGFKLDGKVIRHSVVKVNKL